MPQMSPLNWLSLMISFSVTIYLFNIMNYFAFEYKNTPKSNKKSIKKNINWKW